MSRLFWKFALAFWLAMVVAGLVVAAGMWVLRWFDYMPVSTVESDRLEFMVQTTADLLQQNDVATVRRMLEGWQHQNVTPSLYVINDAGEDLLGRAIALAEVSAARMPSHAATLAAKKMARRVELPDGKQYWVFVRPADMLSVMTTAARELPPPAYVPTIAILIVSSLFAGLLAWYFYTPIKHLRWALHAVTEGKLDTRVEPLMGRNRGEIAGLGREFDRMVQRLQQLVDAQQRLLHDVSHELRSPIARLQAAIGLARQRPERFNTTLDRIELEGMRLDAMVGELLTLARIEAGATQARVEQIDVVELITSIADDAQFEARAAHRDVVLKADGEFIVDAEAELLYRAFENVIRNAVKYTASETCVEVAVDLSPSKLICTVSDCGPGISNTDQDAIFAPFYRVQTAADVSGFGLGLAIAQRAIQSHGGSIVASARSSGGLTMTITLPRTPEPADDSYSKS